MLWEVVGLGDSGGDVSPSSLWCRVPYHSDNRHNRVGLPDPLFLERCQSLVGLVACQTLPIPSMQLETGPDPGVLCCAGH